MFLKIWFKLCRKKWWIGKINNGQMEIWCTKELYTNVIYKIIRASPNISNKSWKYVSLTVGNVTNEQREAFIKIFQIIDEVQEKK